MITYPNVKVNLGLSVLRRRPDGYHDLETLFVPFFGFHDTLEIITGDDYSRISAGLFARYSAGSGCCPAGSQPAADPSHLTMGPSLFRAEGGTSLQGSTGVLPTQENVTEFAGFSSFKSVALGVTGVAVAGIAPENSATLGLEGGPQTKCSGGAGEAGVFRDNDHAAAPMISQAISEDGKVMITIARAEGVDWDPLKDLTAKAYGLLDADFNLPPVKIFLEKTSPVGAGLGGGSADAAFALRMLNELFILNLDDATLASYAARLGSDCAFFIYNRPMLGTGRGEILEPYSLYGIDFSAERKDPDAEYDLRIVIPEGVAVSTADAYRGITPREAGRGTFCPLLEALARPVPEWRDCLENDFETTVFAKYPEIAAVKQRLYDEGAVYAAMSGSGSSVFALFPR